MQKLIKQGTLKKETRNNKFEGTVAAMQVSWIFSLMLLFGRPDGPTLPESPNRPC
jgi:hypothetical protein